MSNIEKVLKYIVWIGLIAICFVPMIIGSSYYFPFIVPKTIVFKIIALSTFLAYLGLATVNRKYRVKFNLILVLFLFYLLIVSFSSFLNGSFYSSFWGNNERSEGLLLLLHLFLFFIVLSGFFNPSPENIDTELVYSKKWLFFFDVSFLSSLMVSLYSLAQYFNLGEFIVSAGDRLTATIGNAGYVAGYLIFGVFFGLILLFFRKNKYLRWYYILGVLLHIFIVLNTLTRGGIIALVFSLIIFIGYLFFFHFKKYKVFKSFAVIFLILTVVFFGFVFSNKNAKWVQKNRVLERITSISANAVTAKNRLMTWESAYKGFKEKPLLGYGYENFYQVFDKYFNPKIYRHSGSVVWFDRAHNIIFDRLITGGIIGLILYLSMLFVPLIYIWEYFYRNKISKGYLIPLFLTLIIVSYFIQNFFIFEALVTYIPLFIILAFLSQYCPSWKDSFFQSKKIYLASLIFCIIAFIPFLFVFTVKPAAANKKFINALILSYEGKLDMAYQEFVELLNEQGPGNQEYVQHFGEFVTMIANNDSIDQEVQLKASFKAEEEFDKQIALKPQNTRGYLMFMRFLNKTYKFNVERLNKSLALFEKAVELSPTKPMLYYEAAYSQIYLGRFYKSQNKSEEAEQLFDQAIANMQKAIDLNDGVIESYVNMCMALFATEKSDGVQAYLDKMDNMGLNYHGDDYLSRIASSAVNAKEYLWTVKLYKELTEIKSDNPDYLVNLALSYAYLGQREQAIEVAKKTKEFGDEYIEQSVLFIQDVLDGKFER
ncbi:O-antigen ligase family protein [Patescibacteria group bacterium]